MDREGQSRVDRVGVMREGVLRKERVMRRG